MGHLERDKKFRWPSGCWITAGIAAAASATLVVFHPGFLLGRTRGTRSTVRAAGELRARLEGKGRVVPFGIEVMGRVRDFGTLDDVLEIATALGWVRPVLDFAHMHATSDGAYTDVELFAAALGPSTRCWRRTRRSTSISPTSPTRTATRPSTSPTARALCARIRWAKRCNASSVRRR